MWRTPVLMICAVLLAACGQEQQPLPTSGGGDDLRAPVTITDWPLPSQRPGTHSPGLSATHDGRLLLSWVNSQRGRRHVFQFSAYDLVHQRWRGTPLTVVIGSSLYIDPDYSPRVIASRDGALWAQWWQGGKPEVMFSRSRDGGANWSEPQTPYTGTERISRDQIAVLAWPEGDQGIGMAWMDGHDDGSVSLRATAMDTGGTPAPAVVLDVRVNECEPPDAALTARGPLLAWRGWDADAAREQIRLVRHEANGWAAPVRIDLDDGGAAHCLDVNGPLLAAHAQTVVIAWSSIHEHENERSVVIRMAVSTDAGDRFAAPVEIARGTGIPFAVAMDARQVWVLWRQADADGMHSLWLSRRSLDVQDEYERREIVRLSTNLAAEQAYSAGFPRFALADGIGYLVWSEVHSAGTNLRGVKIQPSL